MSEFLGPFFFLQSGLNFWDCFRTVLAEFLGLFSDNPDMIFRTVFKQFGTDFRTVCVLFFFMCYGKNLNNMLVVRKSCYCMLMDVLT